MCLFVLLLVLRSGASAQSTSTTKPARSPFNIIKSVETIGSEIISLFGSSDDSPQQNKKGRNSARVVLQLSTGKTVVNGDAKTCEAGNGVCLFKIFLEANAPKDGTLVTAQATLRPKMKRLILQFDQSFSASMMNEQSKVVFSVHRRANDPADEDGIVVVNSTRIAIQNGDYEVVGNKVIFNLL